MGAVKFVSVLFVVTQIFHSGQAKPFLLNSTRLITTLLGASSAAASSSSSFPSDTNEFSDNIKIIPKKESARLTEEEKDREPLDEDDSITFPPNYFTPSTDAPPTFVQRKISKILRKIITLSQISNALQGNDQQENSQYPKYEIEEIPQGYEYDRRQPNVAEFARSDTKFELEEPLKLDLTQNVTVEDNVPEMKDVPKNLGIFVLEIFASLIGLTVGAATQINNNFNRNNTI